jgi:hypothetical protein
MKFSASMRRYALHRSRRRNDARLRREIAEILHDGRAFGQRLAGVELQGRHRPGRIDHPVIVAVGGLLRAKINADKLMRQPVSRSTICGDSEQAPGE